MERKEKKVRRAGHSILTLPDSKKRKEPLRKDETVYVVPKGERKIFHIEAENPFYDAKTGKKLSTPHIIKLDSIKEYRQFVANAYKSGWEYKILHDPRPYLGITKAQIKAQDSEFLNQAGKENRKKK